MYAIQSGVPQGSVLGPILYTLYSADLPTTSSTTIATFADDTMVLASHEHREETSRRVQKHLNLIQEWLYKWRIAANEQKSVQVTFTLKNLICPPVTLNNKPIPQADSAKYLGMHLDKRMTWKTYIWNKRKQLGLILHKLYWLIGPKSKLSLNCKIAVYKCIIKPVWTYGIQLWGSAKNSNIEILERFQNKALRIIVGTSWYVTNKTIKDDLRILSVKEEIKNMALGT